LLSSFEHKWKISGLTYLTYPSPKAFDCWARNNTFLTTHSVVIYFPEGIKIIVNKYNINVVRCLPCDLQAIWRKRPYMTAEHSKLALICW